MALNFKLGIKATDDDPAERYTSGKLPESQARLDRIKSIASWGPRRAVENIEVPDDAGITVIFTAEMTPEQTEVAVAGLNDVIKQIKADQTKETT